LLWRDHLDASRRKLDGERYAVQPPAHFGDDWGVLIGDRKVRVDGASPSVKEGDCTVGKRIFCAKVGRRRHRQ
jgi:hypothetical protein